MMLDSEKLLKFDFIRISHTLSNPHSVGIGLWANWWFKLNNDNAIVLDSIESVTIEGNKRQSDLIFCTNDGKRTGVLEFENDYDYYLKKLESIQYYNISEKFPDISFGILNVWSPLEDAVNYSNNELLKIQNIIKEVKGEMLKLSLNNPKMQYVLYNLKSGKKENKIFEKFEGYNNCYKDFECFIYQNGKELTVKKL